VTDDRTRARLTATLFAGNTFSSTSYILAVTVASLAAANLTGNPRLAGIPSAAGTLDRAREEVRKISAGWARHGANALGLSDQDSNSLRDALADEALAVIQGSADATGSIQSEWENIVRRGVATACGEMSDRAQEEVVKAILGAGPGLK